MQATFVPKSGPKRNYFVLVRDITSFTVVDIVECRSIEARDKIYAALKKEFAGRTYIRVERSPS